MTTNGQSTRLQFRDSNSPRLRIRSVQAGVIQILEGLIDSNPTADSITISVHELEPII
jgi:hypothetical protein